MRALRRFRPPGPVLLGSVLLGLALLDSVLRLGFL